VISVIIDTNNSERALVPTLSNLVAGAADGIVREVIVADSGSTDATAAVADLAGCELMVSRASLGSRLRDAAAKARSEWLMFLQPGVILDAGWTEEVARFIAQAELRGAADTHAAVFRRTAPMVRSPLIEGLAMMRSALGGRPSADQGLLIFRQLYDKLGRHRDNAVDPKADFLARLGRRRTLLLRSGAMKISDIS
jgi:glycosyltransferase involved in cell wall biosynthesis